MDPVIRNLLSGKKNHLYRGWVPYGFNTGVECYLSFHSWCDTGI